MQQVPVRVLKEDEPVAFIRIRLAFELCSLSRKLFVCLVEIVHRNRYVPHSGCPHSYSRRFTLRRNNFNQRPVLRLDKVIAGVLIGDLETKRRNVPLSQPLRIR